ncbi:4Fe-4S binding protein [Thermoflexus sp.]|uniref:4Fe-4S binding protein n=1 Tax=Thermoflexus sp. TaxID=1969742 RepID=UPI0035E42D25
MIYGLGILKGLGVTLKHFIYSYIEDIRYLFEGGRYRPQHLPARQGPRARGVFTVQYPKEKLPLPENFRYIPFLVYDTQEDKIKCTSCGICAKVCPPQCIWIVRGTDPTTGRPKPEPEAFYIDATICMSCGFCAEFCPFDAIKMDHDYELSSYERYESLVFDLPRLLKPDTYHAQIHPSDWAREQAEKEAEKVKKGEKAAARSSA